MWHMGLAILARVCATAFLLTPADGGLDLGGRPPRDQQRGGDKGCELAAVFQLVYARESMQKLWHGQRVRVQRH